MLHVPEEFRRLTRCFLQGSLDETTDVEKWIDQAVRIVGNEHHNAIKTFLTSVLERGIDGVELQRIWSAGSPAFAIADEKELRWFLTRIRDKLG